MSLKVWEPLDTLTAFMCMQRCRSYFLVGTFVNLWILELSWWSQLHGQFPYNHYPSFCLYENKELCLCPAHMILIFSCILLLCGNALMWTGSNSTGVREWMTLLLKLCIKGVNTWVVHCHSEFQGLIYFKHLCPALPWRITWQYTEFFPRYILPKTLSGRLGWEIVTSSRSLIEFHG